MVGLHCCNVFQCDYEWWDLILVAAGADVEVAVK